MNQEHGASAPKSFKDTLNLPHTEFPIRPNAKVDDPALLERWQKEDLYTKAFEHNKGAVKYILHDGPPFANGHIHLGTAYNKVLKDIITKYQRMSGRHVPVTPGWDCHGLPIEINVVKAHPGLSREELKKQCRSYANHWINVQREEFKRLGVIMDWDRPYLTMDPLYEATIIRSFGTFFNEGFIQRKNKTVPWCATCQTVLATVEIEYKDRKDPSIYVLFPLDRATVRRLLPDAGDIPVSLLVWTTTPWTLPLNRAVMVHPHETYELRERNGVYFIVGKTVGENINQMLGGNTRVVTEFPAIALKNAAVEPPFGAQRVPLLFEDEVGLGEGTAVVHIAPGVGPTDYDIGVKYSLEIYSPVSAAGQYTQAVEPKALVGMSVTDGQGWVIKQLLEQGKLLHKGSITHAYPHCWRCRNPLIFRATPQWFLDLSHHDIKHQATHAIDTAINFIPARGRNALKATIENRLEWCISRQRVWGVPIPALLCTICGHAVINQELIEQTAKGVEQEGIEYWDRVRVEELGGRELVCPDCNGRSFVKENDILDVWFESGISHYAVLYHNPALAYPADVYAEGVDQYRGWFQSSLLTCLVLEKEPCTKQFVTHGYVVDAKGQKMSKSLGNVVAPQEVIDQLGTDGLRLWVASVDLEGDPVASDVLFKNVAQVYHKIRNSARFLLSNLYDFDKDTDALPLEELLLLDRFALERLYELQLLVLEAYENSNFTAVFHEFGDYCATELSAFYLDIIKDRLYVEKADGKLRRSAQTACWYILDALTKLMAPVLSFTAELISDYYQKNKNSSIHLQSFSDLEPLRELLLSRTTDLPGVKTPDYLGGVPPARVKLAEFVGIGKQNLQWNALKAVRNAVLKALEGLREQGTIKHSLEAQVILFIDLNMQKLAPLKELFANIQNSGQSLESFLKELFIMSQVTVALTKENLQQSELGGLFLKVDKAEGTKCPRCWQWDVTDDPDRLCHRCQQVLGR